MTSEDPCGVRRPETRLAYKNNSAETSHFFPTPLNQDVKSPGPTWAAPTRPAGELRGTGGLLPRLGQRGGFTLRPSRLHYFALLPRQQRTAANLEKQRVHHGSCDVTALKHWAAISQTQPRTGAAGRVRRKKRSSTSGGGGGWWKLQLARL